MIAGPAVDAHHHLWALRRFPYRWLAPDAPPRPFGDHTPIKRDYTLAAYRVDIASIDGLAIGQSVFVEANTGAADPADESDWVQALCDAEGIPAAIVGQADLTDPGLPGLLGRHLRNPAVRGVRMMLGWDDDPAWRFAPRPHIAQEPAFRTGLARLAEIGLSLDVVILPAQLEELAKAAASVPQSSIAINHLAMPRGNDLASMTAWHEGIAHAAAVPNLHVKISGLWTIDRTWSPSALRGPVRHVVAAFGATRCMYGSNLPVESMMCSARQQIDSLRFVLDGLQSADLHAIFAGTARRFYRLPGPA